MRCHPSDARADLQRLKRERFDVLIIGGGVTGVGAALDAAARGLSVALVESRDLAAGTSSRSSKLIHGGLRYLEQLEFGLVHEALRERGLLATRLAPHLVRPVPILVPLTSDVGRGAVGPVLELAHRTWQRAYLGTGVALYDVFAGLVGHGRGMPRHRHLTRASARRMFPSLRDDNLTGAIRYYDGQVDDARYVTTMARTAASLGAAVVTSARAVSLIRAAREVTGARIRDVESRRRSSRCRPGPWSPPPACGATTSAHLLGETPVPTRTGLHVRASKGVHLVVPRSAITGDAGLILRTADVGAVRAAVGWSLDHRHHRHRLDARPRTSGGVRARHHLPARSGQPVAGPAGHRRRHRGRVRRTAAAALRRGRGHLGAVPGARGGRADARV